MGHHGEEVYTLSKVRSICAATRQKIEQTFRKSGAYDFDILNRFKSITKITADEANGRKVEGLVLTITNTW